MRLWKRPRTDAVTSEPSGWSAVIRRARTSRARQPIEPKTRLGKFEVRGEIASGAFGTVHRAFDTVMNRDVALKVLHDLSDPAAVLNEGRTLAAVRHPNVVTAFDVVNVDGLCLLVMDYIDGPTIETHLRHGPMSWREAAHMGFDVCLAVEAVHDAGVLHRDIKAQNVIRCSNGNRHVLTDFGAGERRELGYGSERTLGTPAYLAPEILVRREAATIASDIYSIGVLLYHAVTNEYPVPGRTALEVLAAHAHGPIPLANRRSDLPAAFVQIVDRAVHPDPAKRQRSAGELKNHLRAALDADLAEAPARLRRDIIPELPSVAVLPFANVAGEQDLEHLCTGVAWEVITGLGQVPGLRVASSASSFASQLAGNTDAATVCKALKVGAVVQGQVRKSGDGLRITAQLVGADGEQLWAEAFDEPDGLGDVQEAIAQRVVRGMKVRFDDLSGRRLTQHTDNRRARNFYLRGRHSWAKRYEGGFIDARQQFEAAIKEDAGYVLAHAALADTYAFVGFYSIGKPRDAFAKARIAISPVREKGKHLPQVHTSLGLIRLGDEFDFKGAVKHFLDAIDLDKAHENVLSRIYLSWVYVLLQDEERALDEMQSALDLEPNVPLINSGAAHTLFLVGRDYATAIQYCDDALHFDPQCIVAMYVKAGCLAKQGRVGDAIEQAERAVALSHRAPFYLAILGNLYGRAGRDGDAQVLLNELAVKPGYVPPHAHAFIHAGLGNLDRAFEWQARAADDGASPFNYFSPLIDNMQADPRHERDKRQMGWPT